MPVMQKQNVEFVENFLRQQMAESGADPAAFARIIRGLRISSGLEPRPSGPPLQNPTTVFFPGLTATPYPDPGDFSTARRLEESFSTIREEFLAQTGGTSSDYDEHRRSVLTDEGSWQEVALFYGGIENEENTARYPRTRELIRSLPDYCPMGRVYYSVASPGTHIAPHCGPNNIRIRCHLGLIVPEDCEIRVATEHRTWEEGKVLMLDDSFEHEVWNRSDQKRVIFLFDVWHPEITPLERQVIGKLAGFLMRQDEQAA